MNKADIDWSYITDNLDKAISEGWIKAYYMPIVRSASGKVCEEEALSRWIDPTRGMLSPAEFIPVLEEAKLIYKLDLHIVDEVLKKMKTQEDAGLYVVPISINLSRTDFDSCDIVDEISKRMDKAGISHDKLSIEITESSLGSNFDYLKAQVARFKDLGFSVWMDDFGSGYSSLDNLQDICFDHIKFDIKFMQNFHSEKSRIMMTELMRMAMALNIRTVAEGVETKEQAEFLREIGCNKMQGYYFCKPIPLEEILERYDKGIQIGFENPAESEYYDQIGGIDLYNLSFIAGDENDTDSYGRYFNTLPIAVYETDDEGYTISKCNKGYLQFESRYYETVHVGHKFMYSDFIDGYASIYSSSVKKCCETGERVFFAETLPDGSRMRAIVRRLAENPVTGITSCAIVILDIEESNADAAIDYSQIARALSSDYIFLYYVNIDTERFTEYSRSTDDGLLSKQREGTDFFENSRKDALTNLHSEDCERFISEFTKEKVLKTIDENNAFVFSYRLIMEDGPVYVNMKIVRMGSDKLIVGVNNVDAQTKLQKEYEMIQAERLTFSRIMALVGDFICIYIVDPETCNYYLYSANDNLTEMNILRSGDDFFEDSRKESMRLLYKEDVDLFNAAFNRENILKEIETNGRYTMIYRLLLDGKPEYVSLNASMLTENGKKKIIIGTTYYN